jgi:hypothetical protein
LRVIFHSADSDCFVVATLLRTSDISGYDEPDYGSIAYMRGVKDLQFRRRVLELRLAGLSYRQIAAAVGHPRNPAYVWRIAKQEMREYTGAPAREVLATSYRL